MKVIDHNTQRWLVRYKNSGRENGAATYSREIARFHMPIWEKYFGHTNMLIATTPLITAEDLEPHTDIIIQYLHSYPYEQPLVSVKEAVRAAGGRRIIFVTAYQQMQKLMEVRGYEAIYIPMAIDTSIMPEPLKRRDPKRIIYFGNLLHGKREFLPKLKIELRKQGIELDTIANNLFNGRQKLKDQSEVWNKVKQYEYGIGVGRCALEMYALGLKVLIAGREFGGIVTCGAEFEQQLQTNFNGRRITHDREIQRCIQYLPYSHTKTNSHADQFDMLELQIESLARELL